jgi:S-(hydroxymethyl)glutathione dehydrogenase/alcohol dehydrogenase
MKAAVLRSYDGPVTIEDVDIARPTGSEVLIRTVAAGLCHSDISAVQGRIRLPLPAVLGHESAGIVEEVGPLVEYVEPGDHVITCFSIFCGHCEYCLSGRPVLCSLAGATRPDSEAPRLTRGDETFFQMAGLSSFAEQLLVHENACVKIPHDFSFAQAALLGCGVTTGFGAVVNTARVPVGASVAIVGCGGVGLSAIQGARVCGANMIIAVDTIESRLERALELGATHAIDASTTDAVNAVLELSNGGVEYSFEVVGATATVKQAFAMTRRGGTCTVVGLTEGIDIEVSGSLLQAERVLQGCMVGSNRFRTDIPRWIELIQQGKLNLDTMVTAEVPIEGINDAIDVLLSGAGVRSVFTFA